MEVLEMDGKRYVKGSVAARKNGYAPDYVSQLCRSGAVDAKLVGRSWYVSPEDLQHHRVEKKRTSRARARDRMRQEVRQRVTHTSEIEHSPNISYELDDLDLFPAIAKQSTEHSSPRKEGNPKKTASPLVATRRPKTTTPIDANIRATREGKRTHINKISGKTESSNLSRKSRESVHQEARARTKASHGTYKTVRQDSKKARESHSKPQFRLKRRSAARMRTLRIAWRVLLATLFFVVFFSCALLGRAVWQVESMENVLVDNRGEMQLSTKYQIVNPIRYIYTR